MFIQWSFLLEGPIVVERIKVFLSKLFPGKGKRFYGFELTGCKEHEKCKKCEYQEGCPYLGTQNETRPR